MPHINEAIREQNLTKVKLDGEFHRMGLSFEEIHSRCSANRVNIHPESYKIQYHIFDLWNVGEIELERRSKLYDLSKTIKPPLFVVPYYLANTYEDIMGNYHGYISQGYEGIIVRNLRSPYVQTRSRFVMKFKPKKFDEYEIEEIVEAISLTGTPKGIMGSVRLIDGKETFRVGAGELTHPQRKLVWDNREELIGEYCKITYQHLTDKGVPRFGLCLRDNSWLG